MEHWTAHWIAKESDDIKDTMATSDQKIESDPSDITLYYFTSHTS